MVSSQSPNGAVGPIYIIRVMNLPPPNMAHFSTISGYPNGSKISAIDVEVAVNYIITDNNLVGQDYAWS